ncbi:NnrS family protein [Azohydromonas caseinilytica]|uniref:NnrS family protein n=1 Tax=Azohydromonas caseinilytica TaxID=2728836 RepID=A0A848F5B9_9BURK|nr:NnrS family protein [Azohydromonas caseinilytica]NML15247.1 NnrS family protein [Azohydromonas caseinilytica]
MTVLLKIEEAPRGAPAPRPQGWALWALGFRPFYLLASGFAALSIALWALQFSGVLGGAYLAGPLWHAHEMVFGFTLAVVVGFLFTAGRNWSGQDTPSGRALMALAALWLLARVLVLTPWGVAAAVANVAFPLLAAWGLFRALRRGNNQRNYFFAGLLVLMALGAALVHAERLGLSLLPGWAGIQIGLDVVLFMMAVMGGRVIPMFTNNGVPGTQATRHPRIEQGALASVLALLVADALGLPGVVVFSIAAVAALLHGARLALWQPWKTLRVPLVWVLHAAYLWIPLHLALRAAAALDLLPSSFATHALTVGAIGGLTIAMMTRTARGHTGRPLRADGFDVACYALVLAAGVVRVGGPLLWPAGYVHALLCSAALWSAGFGLYAVRYWPALTRPRLDGKPG